MNVDHLPEDDTSGSSRTPLIPIGLAIITVLMVPVFLYSVGPEGPLKVGDVVFADGPSSCEVSGSQHSTSPRLPRILYSGVAGAVGDTENRYHVREFNGCRANWC